MDFYSALRDIVLQIPAGKVAFLADIGEALGDRAATVSLPLALRKIQQRCPEVARVVKADGTPALSGSLAVLQEEGAATRESRVVDPQSRSFNGFRTSKPLRELRESQFSCARRVVLRDGVRKPEIVAGFDLSYQDDQSVAVAVLMEMGTFRTLAEAVVEIDVDFPYIPGYLAFRELPPILAALRALPAKPSLLFVDGHGILHPARCGIASQVGVRTKIPTIGVAKSLLVGHVDSEDLREGEADPVRLDGRIMGYAYRSSASKRPIFISPGNLITPKTALRLTRMVCRTRVPEPIRQAHVTAIEKIKKKRGSKRISFCDTVKS